MIKFEDIRDGLSDLIKVEAGLPLLVCFNHVNDPEEDYAFVRLRTGRTDLGYGWLERSIHVDISIRLMPDAVGEIRHSTLYEYVDALDAATLHSIPIADRHITILETSSIIFDGVLTYSFRLDFSDYYQALPKREQADFMQELHLNLEAG